MLRPERGARGVAVAGSGARPWLDHLAIAVALGALLLGYSTVVEGRSWWWTAMTVVAAVLLVGAVARWLGLRWIAPLELTVGLLTTIWLFVPQTLAFGVLPTASSFVGLRTLLDRAQVFIMEEAAPAPAARPVVLVIVLAFLAVVVVAAALVRRRHGPMLLGGLLTAVFVAPALVSGLAPSLVSFLAPAAAWLAVLWSRRSGPGARSGPVAAAVLGAAGLLAGVVVPPALPDVTAVARDWGNPPPEVFGQGINPMLQLGQNLRRGATSVAATYTSDLQDPPYLRVAILRDFNGRTWRPVERGALGRPESAVSIRPDIDAPSEETAISIEELRSTMLPSPYPATAVGGLSREWGWNPVGQTLSSESTASSDEQYTVSSLDVQPTAEQMRALPEPFRPGMQDYLRLPRDVPELVTRTAREVTAGAENDYDRALALQEHFQTEYEYSETAPVAGDYDGNGVRVLEEFLQERSGYCVHFSSGMAVMARELDIPARVVVGYAPGRSIGFEEGEQVYEVTSDDLHAWPELYFEGVGWVGFEPTPSVGSPTEFAEPQTDSAAPDDGEQTSPDESARSQEEEAESAAQQTSDEAPGSPGAFAGVGGLLLVLVLAPAAARAVQRRRRLATEDPEAWWSELRAAAVDHGVVVSRTDTPRSFGARLAGEPGDPGDLARFVEDVERRRYGRPGSQVAAHPEQARRFIATFAGRGTVLERLRARWLPRSLVRRRP
ncbi:transglutaminaseTgpA domain-containing protein [Aeromicrobium sp. CF4.19]|uniref:transglutaminase family protein n=1 Tax=Aeromicrobium sp. CF4.19 TaxID=3373082 RepID=UPI003EE62C7B